VLCYCYVEIDIYLVCGGCCFVVFGLCVMYFLFVDFMYCFVYFKIGLLVVLVWVGVKMLLFVVDVKVFMLGSLAVVVVFVGGFVVWLL